MRWPSILGLALLLPAGCFTVKVQREITVSTHRSPKPDAAASASSSPSSPASGIDKEPVP